jgi:hypothetical protein
MATQTLGGKVAIVTGGEGHRQGRRIGVAGGRLARSDRGRRQEPWTRSRPRPTLWRTLAVPPT